MFSKVSCLFLSDNTLHKLIDLIGKEQTGEPKT